MAIQVTGNPRAGAEWTKVLTGRRSGIVTSAGADWVNPTNVQANDGVFATTAPATSPSTDILIQQFGFSLPPDAIITNMTVYTKGNTSGSFSVPNFQLMVGGAGFGSQSTFNSSSFNAFVSTPSQFLSGLTLGLTSGQINSANFGIRYFISSATGKTTFVDSVEIEIEYYTQTSGHWSSLSPSVVTAALATNDGPDGVVSSSVTQLFTPAAGLIPGVVVHPLRLTDCNFSLPAAAIIVGIQVEVGAEANQPVLDSDVQLLYQGMVWSTDKGTNADVGSTVGVGAPIRTYGNFTNLWGGLRVWDAAAINDASFGVELAYTIGSNPGGLPAQIKIDWVRVTISYFVSVPVSGAISATPAIATAALVPNRLLSGSLSASTGLNTPALPVKHTLVATVPVLGSIMATGLNGGIAYIDTGPIGAGLATELFDNVAGWANINRMTSGVNGSGDWIGTGTAFADTIVLDNFGFNVPTLATVEGVVNIVIDLKDNTGAGTGFVWNLTVRKNGMTTAAVMAGPILLDGTRQTLTIPINLGPLAADPADINAANWGVELQLFNFGGAFNISVFSVAMDLVYHLPAMFKMNITPISASAFMQLFLPAVALSQGDFYPSQYQNETFSGASAPWANLINAIQAPGNATSGPLTPGQGTDRANFSAFGFSVPALAEITGITVTARIRSSVSIGAGLLCDRQMLLMVAGVRAGANKAVAGLTLGGTTGCIDSNFSIRSYQWTRAELQALGLTRTLVNSTTPYDLGFSLQYATRGGATSNPVAQLDWVQMNVQWTTMSGAASATFTLNSPAITRPVDLGVTTLPLTAALPPPTPTVRYTLGSSLSLAATVGSPALGVPFGLSGSLSLTATPGVATLRIGIPRNLAGSVFGVATVSAATLLTDYRFHGAITGFFFLGAVGELDVITTATGGTFRKRMLDVMPPWFGDTHPVLDSVLDGLSSSWLHVFQLIRFTAFQTRISTATEGWLDLIAGDFFGRGFPRKENESDTKYRARIVKEIFRLRGTRQAVLQVLEDLTGRNDHVIIEPQRPLDTGAYGHYYIGLNDGSINESPTTFNELREITILAESAKTAWTNPQNARLEDGTFATVTLAAAASSTYLRFLGLDTGMPAYAQLVKATLHVRVNSTLTTGTITLNAVKENTVGAIVATISPLPTSATERVFDVTAAFDIDSLLHPNSGFLLRANNTGGSSITISVDYAGLELEYKVPGANETYGLGYGVAGIYGSMLMDFQAFIRAKLPMLPGIAFVGGYGVPVFGYGIPSQGVWAKSSEAEGPITDNDVYRAIDSVAPAGTIMWTNISV